MGEFRKVEQPKISVPTRISNRIKPGRFVIELPEHIRIRWCACCYLIPYWMNIRDIEDLPVDRVQDFSEFVLEEVSALMYENKMPNPEIAPAIMNVAEDIQSGDPVKIRSGDYITLQGYFRKNKM